MIDFSHIPLALDIEAVVKVAFGLIVMVLWVVGQLTGQKGKAKPPLRPRPQQPPALGGAPPAGQGGGAPTLEESLRREVEEFMRRAQGRAPAAEQQRSKQKPAPQQAKQQQSAPTRRLPMQPIQPAQSSVARPLPSATTIEAGRGALTGSTVGQHVAAHLSGPDALAAHAKSLGANLAQTDERLEEHLRERFAHRLGSLSQQAVQPGHVATHTPFAAEVFAMLSKPGGMRQLIVANEILKRPDMARHTRTVGRSASGTQTSGEL